MYPYTAVNLKESKANCIKDFLSIVDVYGLSHMIMLTNTDKNSYMRLAKMPRGPTVTFKIHEYSLAADIFENNQKKIETSLSNPNTRRIPSNPKPLTKSFNHVPLVIMNGFNSNKISDTYKEPVKIAAMLIQSFFPPLNLNEIQLKKCKRVVLFNLTFDKESNSADPEPIIEFRHYDIDIEKYSIKKTISNIINSKKKDLSQFQSISDYILRQSGYTSGSDNEDPNLGICDVIQDSELKEDKGKIEANNGGDKIKVKLNEIGPRINMKIYKIEEGFLKGNVTFHTYINKSKKEVKELMEKIKLKRKLKKERKQEQQQNINHKNELKKENDGDETNQGIKIYFYSLFSHRQKESNVKEKT